MESVVFPGLPVAAVFLVDITASYKVWVTPARWTKTAEHERLTKVHTQLVRDELRLVARTSLDDPPGAYGGAGAGGVRWRRGVTAQTRRALEDAEREGRCLDDGSEKPWHFTLVFHSHKRLTSTYVILNVLTDAEIIAAYGETAPR